MKTTLLVLISLSPLAAQALPVVPFQSDPEQLFRSLRNRTPPTPATDCRALDLWECHPDEPRRAQDIALRWVQLDTDPQLEAILTLHAEAEDSNVAYVFDRAATWNLVGSFFCRRNRCDVDQMIRVHKRTLDSPPLLICYRDLGGSGTVTFVNQVFHLRAGQLWPVFQLATYEYWPFGNAQSRIRKVRASDRRLVIHTIEERPPGSAPRNTCEVWQWDAPKFTFTTNAAERKQYCQDATGKPIPGQSYPVSLSLLP